LTPQEIRSAARKEAEKGVEEFKSFAVMGDFAKPYRTMDWSYEKRQLEVVRDMVGKGAFSSFDPSLFPLSRGFYLLIF
jgi:isoleucyl-tRNA synthetase